MQNCCNFNLEQDEKRNGNPIPNYFVDDSEIGVLLAVVKSSKVKSSTAKKSSSAMSPVTTWAQVTGRRGTLKRRRQLQQLFDYHQQQLPDADLFSSTPYRSNNLITVSILCFLLLLFYVLMNIIFDVESSNLVERFRSKSKLWLYFKTKGEGYETS